MVSVFMTAIIAGVFLVCFQSVLAAGVALTLVLNDLSVWWWMSFLVAPVLTALVQWFGKG